MQNLDKDAYMRNGTLYGVSVGPGDPELITVKALKAIAACPVIAAPRTKGAHTLALDIVRGATDLAGKEVVYLDFPMAAFSGDRDDVHQILAEQVFSHLDAGEDVALLNLGDATLYGTWSYIEAIAQGAGYTTATISGVTSFCAAAAALGTSLTEMEQPLHIIPGTSDDLAAELSLPGTKVLMKSGRSLPAVAATLKELGMLDKASMVVNCGLPGERVCPTLEVTGDEGYFAVVLVKA